MYRSSILRLPCERCGAERPRPGLVLSSSGGGYLCWRCDLRAQIATHLAARPRGWPGVARTAASWALALYITLGTLYIALAVSVLAMCCMPR